MKRQTEDKQIRLERQTINRGETNNKQRRQTDETQTTNKQRRKRPKTNNEETNNKH